jgi:putative ABC transport system permease protein
MGDVTAAEARTGGRAEPEGAPADTFPELGVVTDVAPVSVAAAATAGIVAIALGPLFTIRRLRRMDVPATLRAVE